MDVTVKDIPERTVAFVDMHGPYAQMPQAFGALYGWVAQHGYMPVGMPEAVYFTAPDEVPEEQAAWQLRTAVAGNVSPSGPDENGLGVTHVGAETVASVLHKGPYETIEPTYRELAAWTTANGYDMTGPPEEVYMSDPEKVPPEEYLTEVRFPVKRPHH